MNILLVDDEALPLEDMRTSLLPTGYSITTTTKPLKALELYKEHPYDVVISDVRMPVMDGITLLRELRSFDKDARVIIVTAYGDLETAKAALNNRAYAFFGKPIHFPDLIQTLKDIAQDITNPQEPDLAKLKEENCRLKKVYQDLLQEMQDLRDGRG
jgi:DNA-binding NtrC family response regulator